MLLPFHHTIYDPEGIAFRDGKREDGKLLYEQDDKGNFLLDQDGNRIPQTVDMQYGSFLVWFLKKDEQHEATIEESVDDFVLCQNIVAGIKSEPPVSVEISETDRQRLIRYISPEEVKLPKMLKAAIFCFLNGRTLQEKTPPSEESRVPPQRPTT